MKSRRHKLVRAILIALALPAASAQRSVAQAPPPVPPPIPGAPAAPANGATNDAVQLSFQGANIDMVVQWLSQTTGKSVLKHPQAQCQLTIVGGAKLTQREAIALVYRALSMEGFSAIESSNSILIVPEGREPKMDPELVDPTKSVPAGRQRLVKIFTLRHSSPMEVRDKIKPLLSDKALLDVNDRGNQLIVTDYNEGLNLAGDLIAALDTDGIGDRTVRVLSIQHVNAQDLSKELAPLYQKLGAKGGDSVEVSANDRSNSLIILSSEANFQAVERIVRTLDTDDASSKTLTTIPLKNADAEDVAKQVKDLLSSQDGNRFPSYVFYGDSMGSGGSKSRKATIVADRRRNSVVVQAPPAELPGIQKMIQFLDEPVEGEALAPKIHALKYVSAVDVEDVLNELFLKKTQQQRAYWYYDEEPPQTADRNVGRLYGKVRITSEPYSNSIIITANSKEGLAAVEEVLRKLDVPSQAGESTLRVVVKHAKASTVANSLNVLFARNGSPPLRPNNQPQPQNNPQQNFNQNQGGPVPDRSFELERENEEDGYFPWLGGAPDNSRGTDSKAGLRQVSDLVGRVRVVADHRSNSLLLSANVHLLPQILRLIEDLDAPTPQVMIEARIVEVSSNFLDKLGVRWSPDGSRVFTPEDYENSLMIGTKGQYTKGFGGMTTVNTPTGGAVAQALASLQSGVVDSRIGMDFLIQFLRQNVGATVLAEPKITVGDHETAKLFVGSQVPFIKDSQNTQVGSLNQTFSYKDVGVILEVVPHLNKEGDVNLQIRAESSTIQPGQTLFGGAILDTRSFKSQLVARSGQTHVIGGIIQKQESENIRKVPGLGSIPGLGWAFKKKDKSIREVELLVFLKPTVIRNAEEARALADEVNTRMPLIQNWQQNSATNAPGTNTPSQSPQPPRKTPRTDGSRTGNR